MQNTIHENLMQQDIRKIIEAAAKTLSPVWPIETFIACNPLNGYEEQGFETVMQNYFAMSLDYDNHKEIEQINREMIKWSGAFLDLGQGTIEMPNRQDGFYKNFCRLAMFDKNLHQGDTDKKNWLSKLPSDPIDAIKICLEQLNINNNHYEEFIIQTFSFLPGWAGYVKWLSEWSNDQYLKTKLPIDLNQYLAVRLVMTCLIWPEASLLKKKPQDTKQIKQIVAKMKSLEEHYSKDLCTQLKTGLKQAEVCAHRPEVQMVFCIDVRSEPFRRQIECLGDYETLGFAGFFGIPVRVHEFNHHKSKDCCPVLLKPRFDIKTELHANEKRRQQYQRGQDFLQSFQGAYQQLKYNFTTPFNLADAMGPWCGLGMFLKNFIPQNWKKWVDIFRQKIRPNVATDIVIEEHGELGIPHQEQLNHAKLILALMGLKDFAKIVVLCGHQSASTNNPYASGLDCGACGGNHGEYNAKLLAKILNRREIRDDLKGFGVHIPEDTLFVAAVHNTTTDDCELFSTPSIKHVKLLHQLKQDLEQAKLLTNEKRQMDLSDASLNAYHRSSNWSETRPEWGLAKNASFIVGPRYLTQKIDLKGRSFLHSYDWEIDKDGQLLTVILTAPMVVAQWINSQYLFSTLHNVHYGSGSKITHNVVGKLGIMQGNGSDLMHGLPLQSVYSSDHQTYHQAQRLVCVVYAPKEKVMQVILDNGVLQKLFGNQWVNLIVLDPADEQFYRFKAQGLWEVC